MLGTEQGRARLVPLAHLGLGARAELGVVGPLEAGHEDSPSERSGFESPPCHFHLGDRDGH